MNKIQYKFCDGTTSTVEITDDIYEVHLYLLQQEKRLHWREAKHNVSLSYFTEMGIDFEDKRTENPLDICIRNETVASVHKAMSRLTDKRRKLIHKAFYQEMSLRAIAREQGLSHSAVSQQMKTVYKHLRKYL